jgi:hypothetical protein
MSWSIVVVAGLTCIGCSKDSSAPPGPTGSSAPAAPASGSGSTSSANAIAAASRTLKDACSFLPKDTSDRLVPGVGKREGMQFPLSCAVRGSLSAIEIAFDVGPADGRSGDVVPGLGVAGYLERLDPKSPGDVYLTVVLGNDDHGTNHNLHVEVSGHDGKEHKDDAIALARQVLAQLH